MGCFGSLAQDPPSVQLHRLMRMPFQPGSNHRTPFELRFISLFRDIAFSFERDFFDHANLLSFLSPEYSGFSPLCSSTLIDSEPQAVPAPF